MLLFCPACRQATAIGDDRPGMLAAEQFVDFIAEAVALLTETADKPRLADTHMDSPSYRLARAAGVTPKCLRDAASKTVRPGEAR